MGNVQTILNIMRKFTPKGQEEVLKLLKQNRTVLSRELGFAELPSILSGRGQITTLEKELVNKGDRIKGIVAEELGKIQTTSQYNALNTFGTDTFLENMYKYSNKSKGTLQTVPINLIDELTNNFANKKNALIRYCEKNKIVDSNGINYAEYVRRVQKPEELYSYIDDIRICSEKRAVVLGRAMKPKTHLEDIHYIQQYYGDLALEMQKIILSPQKNAEILAIEEKIRKIYGLDFIYIRDVKSGEKILEALKIAKKNNIPIPNNIVVTPYFTSTTTAMGQHCIHTNGATTVMLKADNQMEVINSLQNESERLMYKSTHYIAELEKEVSTQKSTQNPLHEIIHELVHGEKTALQRRETLPERFNYIVENLTDYAKESAKKLHLEETRTELRVEEILQGISKEKKELLDYLS